MNEKRDQLNEQYNKEAGAFNFDLKT